MTSGFTLLEVIVSVLLLEIAVIAAASTLVVAARSMRDAEHLERAVLEAEGVLDSLAADAGAFDGSRPYQGGSVEWTVGGSGVIDLRVLAPDADTLLDVRSGLVRP